jgi:hypothetical protein
MTAEAMADEGFFSRWARRKSESLQGVEPAPEPAHVPTPAPAPPSAAPASHVPAPAAPGPDAAPAEPVRLPTMDDVAQLTNESDFSAFVARGVDQAVRRSALKKLFADPHFNVMDRLDMYMDDYNVASPMSAEMLASLKHSQSFFDRVAEEANKRAEAAAAATAQAAALADPAAPATAASPAGEPAPLPASAQETPPAAAPAVLQHQELDDPAAAPAALAARVAPRDDTDTRTISTTT